MLLSLAACGSAKQEEKTDKKTETQATAPQETKTEQKAETKKEGFTPALDKSVSCHINVAGNYSNFEALEAEFDRFNEYYPDVEMVFTKIDDFNNMIGVVLNGNDAPDIYVNNSWMYGREQYKESIDHALDLF